MIMFERHGFFIMKSLLVLRESVRVIYSKYQVYILPLAKFLLCFVVLTGLNSQLGYMSTLNNSAIVLVVALMASFLPVNFMILASVLFSLGHFYAIGIEAAAAGFLFSFLLLVLYFRFTPKDTLVVLLLPLCFAMKIPAIIPIAVGLLLNPVSIFSIAFACTAYYFIQVVSQNAVLLGGSSELEMLDKFRLVVDGMIHNREMYVMIIAFSFTVFVVYMIRRLSIDHAWLIAIGSGALVCIIFIMVGDMSLNTDISIPATILGSIFSVAIAIVIKFFKFNVDYSRIEKVQFEDDEYYYYVKAIPKFTVSRPNKQVQKIGGNKRGTKISE